MVNVGYVKHNDDCSVNVNVNSFYSSGDSFLVMLSAIFHLDLGSVSEVLTNDALYTSVDIHSCTFLELQEFSKVLNILLQSKILSVVDLPKSIVWSLKYSNCDTPDISTTVFKVGHRLSDIPYSNIQQVTDTNVISSSSTGYVEVVSSPVFILILDDELIIDQYKKLSYCKLPVTKLHSIDWPGTVHLHNETLYVDGLVTIKTDNPIDAIGTVTIKGTPGSTLVLENTSNLQPCIGCATNAGLSFGRWQIAHDKCVKIIIDGVNVICKSVVNNFMIGEYGTNQIPEIQCLNGGTIDVVELKGTRIICKDLEPISGSTKHSDYVTYGISTNDSDIVSKVLKENYNITDSGLVSEIKSCLPECYTKDVTSCLDGLEQCLSLILQ